MKTARCPLCRVAMEHNTDGDECPECGHFEPALTLQDVIADAQPSTDKISAWAALSRAVVDNLPDV